MVKAWVPHLHIFVVAQRLRSQFLSLLDIWLYARVVNWDLNTWGSSASTSNFEVFWGWGCDFQKSFRFFEDGAFPLTLRFSWFTLKKSSKFYARMRPWILRMRFTFWGLEHQLSIENFLRFFEDPRKTSNEFLIWLNC